MFFECSLENLTTVTLALVFIKKEKNYIIEFCNQHIQKRKPLPAFPPYIFSAEILNSKVDPFPLPNAFKIKLKKAIRYVDLELSSWVQNNIMVLNLNVQYFVEALEWNERGKMDVVKTINTLINDERLCVYNRFLTSCRFCCEIQVDYLWDHLSAAAKSLYLSKDDFLTRFWKNHLRDRILTSGHTWWASNEYSYTIIINEAISLNNIQAVRYFWHKLSLACKSSLLSLNNSLSDELVMFFFSQLELREDLLRHKACSILKSYLNNWLWHGAFFFQLDVYRKFLSDENVADLLEAIIDKMESNPLIKNEMRELFRRFWKDITSDRKVHMVSKVLSRLLNLGDIQSFIMIVCELTAETINSYLNGRHPNVISIAIKQGNYDALEQLLRIVCKTDEVAEYKINCVIQNSEFLSVLEKGDLELFIKIVEWAYLPEDVWQKFKTDVLLNEERFHFFRKAFFNWDVTTLERYLNYLFSTKEEISVYKKEVLIPKYAESLFLHFLYGRIFLKNLHQNVELASQFLNFCFSNKEEKDVFKKKTIFKDGPNFCSHLIQYDKLDWVLQFCSLTSDEKAQFKLEMFINNGNKTKMVQKLMLRSGRKLYDRILRECLLTPAEIVIKKKEIFFSEIVMKYFCKKIFCIGRPNNISWKTLVKVVLWFVAPSHGDVEKLESEFLKLYPRKCKCYEHFFKQLNIRVI